MRVAVGHMGARRYYALPRAFHARGALASFHTDIFLKTRPGRFFVEFARRAGIGPATDLAGRFHEELNRAPVNDYKGLGLANWFRRRRTPPGKRRELNRQVFQAFDRHILRRGLGGANVVYLFPGEALDVFSRSGTGVVRLLDQNLGTYPAFRRILDEERDKWPGWEPAADSDGHDDPLAEREEQERRLADAIVTPSGFVVESLKDEGVPAHKVDVVPYPTDLAAFAPKRREPRQGPLRVLFLGSLSLRKGVPYLLESAARLGPAAVTVRAVGSIELDWGRLGGYAAVAEFPGRVPRSRVAEELDWADVLCMPSLWEGQSLVTNEALAAGLPVICTPNTGSRVRDGVDGRIVPARDVEALTEALERYVQDRGLVREHSERAIRDRGRLGFDAYAETLFETVERRFEGCMGDSGKSATRGGKSDA